MESRCRMRRVKPAILSIWQLGCYLSIRCYQMLQRRHNTASAPEAQQMERFQSWCTWNLFKNKERLLARGNGTYNTYTLDLKQEDGELQTRLGDTVRPCLKKREEERGKEWGKIEGKKKWERKERRGRGKGGKRGERAGDFSMVQSSGGWKKSMKINAQCMNEKSVLFGNVILFIDTKFKF